MPPLPGCPERGPPSSEVTGAFCRVPSTPFAHSPGYLLPVHLCRFRVRSLCRRCFPEGVSGPANPIRRDRGPPSSRPGRLGSINPLPLGDGSRPRLRGPANPARNDLAQEPLDIRRAGFSPALRYSCQHSHFRSLHAGSHPRFLGLRNAPLPRALARPPAASVRGFSPVTFSARDCC